MLTSTRLKEILVTFLLIGLIIALALPLYSWSAGINYDYNHLTLYGFFPLLGLLVFTIIWLQIIAVSFKFGLYYLGLNPDKFLARSGLFFLAFIILHPFLLAVAQYQNGLGLPPASTYAYEPSAWRIYLNYAMIAITVFLLSEVAARLSTFSFIQKTNRFIEYINYIAFYFIFWHSIHLSTNLQMGNLGYLWVFYAVSAFFMLSYKKYQNYYPQKT